MDDIVIIDTACDLPKLLSMTPQEQTTWYNSLGSLERAQLAAVCSTYIGLHIARAFVDATKKIFEKANVPHHHQ